MNAKISRLSLRDFSRSQILSALTPFLGLLTSFFLVVFYRTMPRQLQTAVNFLAQYIGFFLSRLSMRKIKSQKSPERLLYASFYMVMTLLIFSLYQFPLLGTWGLGRFALGICNAGVWILMEDLLERRVPQEHRAQYFSFYVVFYHIGGLLAQLSVESMRYVYKPQHIWGSMFGCFICSTLLPRILIWSRDEKPEASVRPSFRLIKPSFWILKSFNYFKHLSQKILFDAEEIKVDENKRLFRFSPRFLKNPWPQIRRSQWISEIFTFLGAVLVNLPLFCLIDQSYLCAHHPSWQTHRWLGLVSIFLGMLTAGLFRYFTRKTQSPWLRWRSAFYFNICSIAMLMALLAQKNQTHIETMFYWKALGFLGYGLYPSLIAVMQRKGEGKSAQDLIVIMDTTLSLTNGLFGLLGFILQLRCFWQQSHTLKEGHPLEDHGFENPLLKFFNGYLFLMVYFCLPERMIFGLKKSQQSASTWLLAKQKKAAENLRKKMKKEFAARGEQEHP